MGYYHVGETGKGMYMGDLDDVSLKIEKLAPFLPKFSETKRLMRAIPKELLKTYDKWPLLWKVAALDANQTYKFQHGCMNCFEDPHVKKEILIYTLHFFFEKRYGYPLNSFTSISDYDHNVMIYCSTEWPPKVYNKRLSELTEKKLEKQLREFLTDVTGDHEFEECDLEVCEMYTKD